MKAVITFILTIIFAGAMLSPILLAIWHIIGRHIWKKLPTWTQHTLTTAAVIGILLALYGLSRTDLHTEFQDSDTGHIRRQMLEKDLWGNINQAKITYSSGVTYTGTPDADGDFHGKWHVHVPASGRLIADNRIEWYFHGEKCTKAEFYKWSD